MCHTCPHYHTSIFKNQNKKIAIPFYLKIENLIPFPIDLVVLSCNTDDPYIFKDKIIFYIDIKMGGGGINRSCAASQEAPM